MWDLKDEESKSRQDGPRSGGQISDKTLDEDAMEFEKKIEDHITRGANVSANLRKTTRKPEDV